jgi:FAD binding domain-containing protein/DAPG hydrolase-like protein
MGTLPAGRHFFRSDDGYEAARRATVWHERVPERYPEVIVQAVDADDIIAGLRYARSHGHQVSVVSGGHSFAASHLRDGAVLLDVGRLDHATIDAEKRTAVVGPGKGGSPLMADLEAQGLFFPGGHCKGVCVGGYLLQGGYGWNSRVYGPACESVVGLDVITADGEQIHCDADDHADLFFSARGAGPGFFGVVTSRTVAIPSPSAPGWGRGTRHWTSDGSSTTSGRPRPGPKCGPGSGWADRSSPSTTPRVWLPGPFARSPRGSSGRRKVMARNLLVHCAQEMNHLAGFLPELYELFGDE